MGPGCCDQNAVGPKHWLTSSRIQIQIKIYIAPNSLIKRDRGADIRQLQARMLSHLGASLDTKVLLKLQ